MLVLVFSSGRVSVVDRFSLISLNVNVRWGVCSILVISISMIVEVSISLGNRKDRLCVIRIVVFVLLC